MGRGGAGLIAAVLALAGCKSTESKPTDKEAAGTAASRTRGKDGSGPAWLEPTGKGSITDVGGPRAVVSDPKNPNARSEAQDCVGGRVVDASNRPAKNVFLRVEAVNGTPGSAAAIGIYTDQNGYFFTRGLKPGKPYNLTAETMQDGKQIAGSAQTLIPNPALTIVLRDDLGLPPVGMPKGSPGGTPASAFPPPPVPSDGSSDRIPAMGLGPVPKPSSADGAWSPGSGATRPVPSTIGSPPPSSPGGALPPPPDDLSAPAKPLRPENVADGPKNPWVPPPVSIPGPPTLPPTYPAPYSPPVTPESKKMGIRSGSPSNFALVDTLERNWEFAANKSGSVLLVEFMTTTCINCKQTNPVLIDLQSRHGAAGLQVIGVACDDLPQRQRAMAASKYARDNNLNYALFVEPGAVPGGLRDRYDVQGYPTVVLLDATGAVLWQGHPNERAKLEAAIKKALGN